MRLIFALALVGLGFGGGFYAGIEYRNHQIKEDPEKVLGEFLRDYGKELKNTVRDKVNDFLKEDAK